MRIWQLLVVTVMAAAILAAAVHYTHTLFFPYILRGDPTANQPIPKYVPLSVRELRKAQAELDRGDHARGRAILEAMLVRYPDDDGSDTARQILSKLNTGRFFSSQPSARHLEYVVRSGDALASIARRFDSTPRMIMQWNDLDSTVIHPGDKLVVPKLDFRVRVDLPEKRIVVEDEGGFFAQFPITRSAVPKGRATTKTKVAGKIFWKNGKPLPATSADTDDADVWINLRLPGYTIFHAAPSPAEKSKAPAGIDGRRPGQARAASRTGTLPARGIELAKDDVETLQALVRRGTPVTITR